MTQPAATATRDEPTPAEYSAQIRRHLETIRRAWLWLQFPTTTPGGAPTGKPGSRPPIPVDPLSLRAEITHDLAYWCHALLEDHPEGRRADAPLLDLTDVPAMLEHLLAETRWIGGWAFAKRMEDELRYHAIDARTIAWPRTSDSIFLGECPVTIGAGGEAVTCGGRVRATARHVGDIPCPRCKTKDTIEGWLLRIVGTDRPVTIPQLVPILAGRLGVRVDERTLQRWHKAGRITPCDGTEGKPLFDRRHVLTVVVAREAMKGQRSA
ncbi:hypothetical protein [Knoellia sp. LjRoot47]|uniref:hypothetical protein n=1 Tax=Knoellia sp. LjRoot47 TaxID=3342330 RepID=UPI003ECCB22B